MKPAIDRSGLRRLPLTDAMAAGLLAVLLPAPHASAQVPSVETQIAAATLPLPEEMRDRAAVFGYDEAGQPRLLREGDNGMICLADDPSDDRFRTACYPESLHALITRDRELRDAGVEEDEREGILEREVEEGRITLPGHPATLHGMAGPAGSYDGARDSVGEEMRRFKMIFTPYRTADEMGLPDEQVGDAPWVMDSGRLFSHIMVLPGADRQEGS